jgi:hypothetical protein
MDCYLFLVYNREHLCGVDNPINFKVAWIKILTLLNGFLIIVALSESLEVCLVEAVDLVLHVLAEGVDLILSEPVGMEVAPALIFDKIFFIIGIFSFSSP